jgi:hypothetical protein
VIAINDAKPHYQNKHIGTTGILSTTSASKREQQGEVGVFDSERVFKKLRGGLRRLC